MFRVFIEEPSIKFSSKQTTKNGGVISVSTGPGDREKPGNPREKPWKPREFYLGSGIFYFIAKSTFLHRRLEKPTFPPLEGLQNTRFSPLLWKVSVATSEKSRFRRMCYKPHIHRNGLFLTSFKIYYFVYLIFHLRLSAV